MRSLDTSQALCLDGQMGATWADPGSISRDSWGLVLPQSQLHSEYLAIVWRIPEALNPSPLVCYPKENHFKLLLYSQHYLGLELSSHHQLRSWVSKTLLSHFKNTVPRNHNKRHHSHTHYILVQKHDKHTFFHQQKHPQKSKGRRHAHKKEHAASAAWVNVEPTKMKTNFAEWSLQIKAHGWNYVIGHSK
jgi:hypothetical protein